jgi:hypothetical protein
MTLLGTKYNTAENWSARLPLARDIFQQVRSEGSFELAAVIPQTADADSLSFEELERLTNPNGGSL